MIAVTFNYDEESRTWDPIVTGAVDETEARHAFSAVVVTCQQLDPFLLRHSKTQTIPNGIKVIPAV